MKTKRIFWSTLILIVVGSMLLTACANKATEAPATEEVPTIAALPQGQELANAFAGM
jgi:uncharacterized lipoprotein YajG